MKLSLIFGWGFLVPAWTLGLPAIESPARGMAGLSSMPPGAVHAVNAGAGDQVDPHIDGDIAGNRLSQLTSTPVDEVIDDISSHDGLGRVVYCVPGPNGDYDVFASSFQLDASAEAMVTDLLALVRCQHLADGIETSRLGNLEDARGAGNILPPRSVRCADLPHQRGAGAVGRESEPGVGAVADQFGTTDRFSTGLSMKRAIQARNRISNT